MSMRFSSLSWAKLDGPRKVLLISCALLAVPIMGVLVALKDLLTSGRYSTLAVLLLGLSIFTVPTTLILSGALVARFWPQKATHRLALALCLASIVLALACTVCFFDSCLAVHVLGLATATCH